MFPPLRSGFTVNRMVDVDSVRNHPDLQEQQRSRTFLPSVMLPLKIGCVVERLMAMTRFVTRMVCHAATPGGRAETAVLPVGWPVGMSGI